MARCVSIYVLKDPRDLMVRYVGQTVQKLVVRLRKHLTDPCVCYRTNWLNQLKLAGLVPLIECVEIVPENQWSEAERRWIKHFKQLGCSLVNGTDGGGGMLGLSPSSATRLKLSTATKKQFSSVKARKAVSRVHKGKKLKPYQKLAVSKSSTLKWKIWRESGSKYSEATIEKMRRAARARVLNMSMKSKLRLRLALSKACRGKPKSDTHRKKLAEHLRKVVANRMRKYYAVKGLKCPEKYNL